MCRYYVELAMSVLLLLSMIFVFSQQTLLHIKSYTSFNIFEEENENEIFKLAFWDFFLFAVKKKKYYTRFILNFPRLLLPTLQLLLFRTVHQELQNVHEGRKTKTNYGWRMNNEYDDGRPKLKLCVLSHSLAKYYLNTLWHKIVVIVYLFTSDVFWWKLLL